MQKLVVSKKDNSMKFYDNNVEQVKKEKSKSILDQYEEKSKEEVKMDESFYYDSISL